VTLAEAKEWAELVRELTATAIVFGLVIYWATRKPPPAP
jgi:hypothetical protein